MTDAPDAAALIAARPALSTSALDGLMLDFCPLASIAARFGTPSFVLSAATLRNRARLMRAAFPDIAIHYAVKANDHLAALSLFAAQGLGADIVSGGELRRALKAGFPPTRIVFSGVGKTASELALALDAGIGRINVESAEELNELSAIAAARGQTAPVALRVNPDVDAGTHAKITTGRAGDKFGIPLGTIRPLYAAAASMPGIALRGLATHIGSQISSLAAYRAAYQALAAEIVALRAAGLSVSVMDCGGGLAYPYANEPVPIPEAWAGAIHSAFAGLDLSLAIEPGRWLTAPAGLLLTE